MFLILLRTAIGWHFAYESWTKLHPSKDEPSSGFSAEGYLRASTGPLAPKFRALIPDLDGFDRLDEKRLKKGWRDRLDRIAAHFHYDDKQRATAETALESADKNATNWFRDAENVQKLDKYRKGIDRLEHYDLKPPATSYERERSDDLRKETNADRREMLRMIDGWTATLEKSWLGLATDEQIEKYGFAPGPAWTKMDYVNQLTIYGLLIMGVCLMFGFLTPVAALSAAAFLAMIYLSMPPWPDLPKSPVAEGHYLFVNKNLIEMLACLVLAATPNGLWLGLDALFFGWMDRRKNAGGLRDESNQTA
ncbi:MAG: hypothetical protein NVSMB14_05680 [Isosphaeraceae bacterium]